ncbi:MAG TPA: PHB depolymerase family esterase [Casimicrobiaceae bacterium]|nr:PHB depolymerase family esterase [Casimicrobiaceae bacterium]
MTVSLWTRAKALAARLFRRAPAAGRWTTGAKFSWRGWLTTLPWLWPRREYLLYLPAGWSRWRRAPLLLLCHGCKQTPEEFAQGTRIAALADREGWLVLMPRQKDSANAWRCWNWFDQATGAGRGEAAIVAAMVRSVRRWRRADPARVVAVGMSAGGALAAVLGLRAAGVVRAAAVHSGVACGAALSAFTAIGVMQRGPETDVEAIAASARGADPSAVPLLAIHGEADGTVATSNATALVRQYLRFNGHPAVPTPMLPASSLPPPDSEHHELHGGRMTTTREWSRDGRIVVRYVSIAGLGHAWSGGDDALPYNDAQGPDATALVADFIRDALA